MKSITVYGEKSWNVFIKNLNFFSTEIMDDMGVSKLSAKVFFFSKVNYSFKKHFKNKTKVTFSDMRSEQRFFFSQH